MAFVRGIHQSPVNSPHKGPVTRKIFPFDDVIMINEATLKWVSNIGFITVRGLNEATLKNFGK